MDRVTRRIALVLAALVVVGASFGADSVDAQVTAFKQAVAETAAKDADIATFYKENGYQPIWVGGGAIDAERRAQLIAHLEDAGMHGLPAVRYKVEDLKARMASVRTARDRGALEVEMSKVFLKYARDMQTGALVPSRVDREIVRDVPYRDRLSYLIEFSSSQPRKFFRELPPQTSEYAALMKKKLRLERLIAQGGWGPTVGGSSIDLGESGAQIVALRDRLIRMGYLRPTNKLVFNADMQAAVQEFQVTHGLEADGVVGPGTLKEINVSALDRLRSVVVAMERERWMNRDRGKRHILVNIPDFSSKIVENGKVTFSTRSVMGAPDDNRPTPEFSDVMEFMVINPSWHVPRSIIAREYLPALQQNPYAVSHLEITDRRGRLVNRGAVNFGQYTARTFPFSMRQPPSTRNALGLVKFMFPNRHNIYLHDTPAKNLFSREVRAYSHGCIRLADPFDFAYALLAKQEYDPKAVFQRHLSTGRETRVNLQHPVPVHLIYRTAFRSDRGEIHFRRDIYGRDRKIWTALSNAGVALGGVQG